MTTPDPVTLAGVRFPQLSPLGLISVRATVPLNPFMEVIVMEELLDWPTLIATDEVGEIVKSGDEAEVTTYVIVTE